jgi:hypothetical protein
VQVEALEEQVTEMEAKLEEREKSAKKYKKITKTLQDEIDELKAAVLEPPDKSLPSTSRRGMSIVAAGAENVRRRMSVVSGMEVVNGDAGEADDDDKAKRKKKKKPKKKKDGFSGEGYIMYKGKKRFARLEAGKGTLSLMKSSKEDSKVQEHILLKGEEAACDYSDDFLQVCAKPYPDIITLLGAPALIYVEFSRSYSSQSLARECRSRTGRGGSGTSR